MGWSSGPVSLSPSQFVRAAPPIRPDMIFGKDTMRMTLLDAATRAKMLATGIERGMEASFVRLEAMN